MSGRSDKHPYKCNCGGRCIRTGFVFDAEEAEDNLRLVLQDRLSVWIKDLNNLGDRYLAEKGYQFCVKRFYARAIIDPEYDSDGIEITDDREAVMGDERLDLIVIIDDSNYVTFRYETDRGVTRYEHYYIPYVYDGQTEPRNYIPMVEFSYRLFRVAEKILRMRLRR